MDTVEERPHPVAGLIRRIEVLRYRGLNYVSQDVMPSQWMSILKACNDPALNLLKLTLTSWFGV
jgi:hypothetical protein